MQVTEISSDGLKRDFQVVAPAATLDARMQERLVKLAETISLPGFRPGKVPMSLLRKKYASAVMGEVLEAVVNEGVTKILTDGDLKPALQPKVEITAFAEGADLEFKVSVEQLPEITVMDLATITLEREVPEIPEAELDPVLAGIAERNGETSTVERAAASGDTVVIDFVGKRDGEAFPGGTAEGYALKLGSNTFIPGFEDQLIGKSAGEDALIEVTFPEGYGNEALAGQPATFEVKVHEVQEGQPAAIDDDLAKAVGMETLDALKAAIREELGRDLNRLARMKVKRALLDILAANHDFPLPGGMVDAEFEHIWGQVSKDLDAGTLDPEDKGKSEETLKAEYRTLAERRVRLGLLLAEIGRANQVAVSQEDINRAILNEARSYPGQEHLVLQYYQKNKDAIEALRGPVFEEKIVDFILELAQVTDRTVPADELRKSFEADEDDASAEAPAEESAENEAAKPKKPRAPRKKSAE